jgi:hypothetical protein
MVTYPLLLRKLPSRVRCRRTVLRRAEREWEWIERSRRTSRAALGWWTGSLAQIQHSPKWSPSPNP